MNTLKNKIWICMVHVSCEKENRILDGSNKAYVNIIAKSQNKNSFIKMIENALADYKLKLLNIEDIELFSEREKKYKIDESLYLIYNEVKKNSGLRFGIFHTYNSD